MDTGSVKPVTGVYTQRRRGSSQRVTGYKVRYSKNGRHWHWVDGGRVFKGNHHNNDNVVTQNFRKPVHARYVRLVVQTWSHHISMRSALKLGRGCSGSGSVHRKLSLHHGWKPYGHGYGAPRTVLNGDICVASGLIKRHGGMHKHLTTLPAGCRPNKRVIFNLNNHQHSLRVDVLPNGQVHYVAGTWKHGWINLDGIQFSVRHHKAVGLHNGW
jgi:hypothetical protein